MLIAVIEMSTFSQREVDNGIDLGIGQDLLELNLVAPIPLQALHRGTALGLDGVIALAGINSEAMGIWTH
jgi:hypothetical protein